MNWFKRPFAPSDFAPNSKLREMEDKLRQQATELLSAQLTATNLRGNIRALETKLSAAEQNFSFACQRIALLEMEMGEKA